MVPKTNIEPGLIYMPKTILAQFEVEPGDKVLVKPILEPT